jgi:hypothetical protein
MDVRIPDQYEIRQWARDIVVEEMRSLANELRRRAESCIDHNAELSLNMVASVIENIYVNSYPVPYKVT